MENHLRKEDRSEIVSVWVTPTVKKELEAVKNNDSLKESLIKRYLKDETDWLNRELKEIDEATIKYSAKLIGIKDAFSKCQDAHIEEIEAIYTKASETFSKINNVCNDVNRNINNTKNNLSALLQQISIIDFYKINKLLETVDKINSMSEKELELLRKVLSSNN